MKDLEIRVPKTGPQKLKFFQIDKREGVYIRYWYDKNFRKPIYIGGGINPKNAKAIIRNTQPHGLDISRGLKDANNNLCENKLNKLLKILSDAA